MKSKNKNFHHFLVPHRGLWINNSSVYCLHLCNLSTVPIRIKILLSLSTEVILWFFVDLPQIYHLRLKLPHLLHNFIRHLYAKIRLHLAMHLRFRIYMLGGIHDIKLAYLVICSDLVLVTFFRRYYRFFLLLIVMVKTTWI